MTNSAMTIEQLPTGSLPKDADVRYEALGGDESVIPKGHYCYTHLGYDKGADGEPPRMRIKPCPYLGNDPDRPEQQSGYCAELKAGDWEEGGTVLLWDMTKECDVNIPTWEEDDAQEAELKAMRDKVTGGT